MNIVIPSGLLTALEAAAVGLVVSGLNAAQTAISASYPQYAPFVLPVVAALAAYVNSLVGNPAGNAVKAFKCALGPKQEEV
jgi:hypothetical protein